MQVGTWCIIPSPQVASVLAQNLDFVIVDREHGNASYEDVYAMCAAVQRIDKLCFARPSSNNEAEILHLMDSGVDGIIIPHVQHVKDVERFIEYTNYPPKGNRGYTPFVQAGGYGAVKERYGKESTRLLNDTLYRAIIIEDMVGVNNLSEMVHMDFDMVYIGIYDLSISIGCEMKDRRLQEIVQHIIRTSLNAGKSVGAIFHTKEEMQSLQARGITHAVYKTDTAILYDSVREVLS